MKDDNNFYDKIRFLSISAGDTIEKIMDAYGVYMPSINGDSNRKFRIIGSEYPDSLVREIADSIIIEFPVSFECSFPHIIDLENFSDDDSTFILYRKYSGKDKNKTQIFRKGTIVVNFFRPYRITGNFEAENNSFKLKNGTFDLTGVYY